MSLGCIREWLSILADLATAGAVVAGVVIANKQLSAWKPQTIETRNAAVAEELLFAVANVDEALRYIRNPWGRIPAEGEEKWGHEWRERLLRMDEKKSAFDELTRASIKARAFLGGGAVEEAIRALFDVRQEVFVALDSLFRREDRVRDAELVKFYDGLQRQVWGTYSEQDEIGQRQIEAVKLIERQLFPVIRMQSTAK